MVAPAQEHQVVETRCAAVDPAGPRRAWFARWGGVLHVMRVAAPGGTAREPAVGVSRQKGATDAGRHRARLAADVEGRTGRIVMHRHEDASHDRRLRRFCGNVDRAVVDLERPATGLPLPPPPELPLLPQSSGHPDAAPPGNGRRLTRDPDPPSMPPRRAGRAHRPVAAPATLRPPGTPAFDVPRASWNNRSLAASSARWTTAPTSGVRRPRITTMPSSSTQVERCRCRCRDSACAAAAT